MSAPAVTRRAAMAAGGAALATTAVVLPVLAHAPGTDADAQLVAAWQDLQTFTVEWNEADPRWCKADGDLSEAGDARLSELQGVLRETPAITMRGLLAKAVTRGGGLLSAATEREDRRNGDECAGPVSHQSLRPRFQATLTTHCTSLRHVL